MSNTTRTRRSQVNTDNIIPGKRTRRRTGRTTQDEQEKAAEAITIRREVILANLLEQERAQAAAAAAAAESYKSQDVLANMFSNLTIKPTEMYELERLFSGLGGARKPSPDDQIEGYCLKPSDFARVVDKSNKRVEAKTRQTHSDNLKKVIENKKKTDALRRRRLTASRKERTLRQKRLEMSNAEKRADLTEYLAHLQRGTKLRTERARRHGTTRKRTNTAGWSESAIEMLEALQDIRNPSPMDSNFGMIEKNLKVYMKKIKELKNNIDKLAKPKRKPTKPKGKPTKPTKPKRKPTKPKGKLTKPTKPKGKLTKPKRKPKRKLAKR